MKLKCDDGVVRHFSIAYCDGDYLPNGERQDGFSEARCEDCGKLFGVHDTRILKSKFKNHICGGWFD